MLISKSTFRLNLEIVNRNGNSRDISDGRKNRKSRIKFYFASLSSHCKRRLITIRITAEVSWISINSWSNARRDASLVFSLYMKKIILSNIISTIKRLISRFLRPRVDRECDAGFRGGRIVPASIMRNRVIGH